MWKFIHKSFYLQIHGLLYFPPVHLCTVLSDENKRFLYDVGVYDSDDDENVSFNEKAFSFFKILNYFNLHSLSPCGLQYSNQVIGCSFILIHSLQSRSQMLIFFIRFTVSNIFSLVFGWWIFWVFIFPGRKNVYYCIIIIIIIITFPVKTWSIHKKCYHISGNGKCYRSKTQFLYIAKTRLLLVKPIWFGLIDNEGSIRFGSREIKDQVLVRIYMTTYMMMMNI